MTELVNLSAGSQKLADGSQGITTLVNGINALDSGSQKTYGQFSSSGDTNEPSLYDGITAIDNGTQKVSDGARNYADAVNDPLYMMIKSNPYASNLLDEYENKLNEAVKAKDGNQVKMFSNMISIYTAAIVLLAKVNLKIS